MERVTTGNARKVNEGDVVHYVTSYGDTKQDKVSYIYTSAMGHKVCAMTSGEMVRMDILL